MTSTIIIVTTICKYFIIKISYFSFISDIIWRSLSLSIQARKLFFFWLNLLVSTAKQRATSTKQIWACRHSKFQISIWFLDSSFDRIQCCWYAPDGFFDKPALKFLRLRLLHWMIITIEIIIFITSNSNKVCCNIITKPIH